MPQIGQHVVDQPLMLLYAPGGFLDDVPVFGGEPGVGIASDALQGLGDLLGRSAAADMPFLRRRDNGSVRQPGCNSQVGRRRPAAICSGGGRE